jgi:hypothetical protein
MYLRPLLLSLTLFAQHVLSPRHVRNLIRPTLVILANFTKHQVKVSAQTVWRRVFPDDLFLLKDSLPRSVYDTCLSGLITTPSMCMPTFMKPRLAMSFFPPKQNLIPLPPDTMSKSEQFVLTMASTLLNVSVNPASSNSKTFPFVPLVPIGKMALQSDL